MMLQSAAVLRKGYAALQVPVYIAAGDSDRIVETWHSQQLRREVRTSEVLGPLVAVGRVTLYFTPLGHDFAALGKIRNFGAQDSILLTKDTKRKESSRPGACTG